MVWASGLKALFDAINRWGNLRLLNLAQGARRQEWDNIPSRLESQTPAPNGGRVIVC